MKKKLKAIILHPCDQCFLDHVVPLSSLLDIPTFIWEENTYKFCQKYYPSCKTIYAPRPECSYEKLVLNYDIIFSTSGISNTLLIFRKLHNKEQIYVYFPHGNSDKGKDLMKHLPDFDIMLYYGQHMKYRFIKQQYWEKIKEHVKIGNLRYSYYVKNKEFYDDLVEKEIFSRLDKKKKTILYAPTWDDSESVSSFFIFMETLFKTPLEQYNFLIRPHWHTYIEKPVEYTLMVDRIKEAPNFFLANSFPAIYPLLECVDGFIGDFSSVGYDFLYYRRPMFFIDLSNKPAEHQSKYLHSCGISIDPYSKTCFEIINKNMNNWPEEFQRKQQELFSFSYGENKSFGALKESIQDVCHKLWADKNKDNACC